MKRFCLLLIIGTLAGCFGSEPQKTGKEGKPMPEFSLLLMDSTTWLHSRNIAAGKPTILFYLSPYCPHCKAQTKTIIEHIDDLKDIQFLFISNFPLPAVKRFYKEHQLGKYSNINTGIDSAHLLGDYLEIPGVPYLAIYNRNKILNKAFLGKIYSSQLKKIAEQ